VKRSQAVTRLFNIEHCVDDVSVVLDGQLDSLLEL